MTIIPATSIQIPRYIAQAVKAMVAPTLFALNVQAAYWETWHQVWRAPTAGK